MLYIQDWLYWFICLYLNYLYDIYLEIRGETGHIKCPRIIRITNPVGIMVKLGSGYPWFDVGGD